MMMQADAPIAQLSDLIPVCSDLPPATVDQLVGATRVISHAGGRMNHSSLAKALHFSDTHTVGTVGFLSRLGLVDAIGSEVALTDAGKKIASLGIAARRRHFAERLAHLPIVRHVLNALAEQPERSMLRDQLLIGLGAEACAADANKLFDHLIAWGRYAHLFTYDEQTEVIGLPQAPRART
jgi:NitT/TauT family transport system ATP-binding protein